MVQIDVEKVLERIEIVRSYGITRSGYLELEKFRDELRVMAGLPSVKELMTKEVVEKLTKK